MSHGLQIFAADGVTKTFDSTTAVGGCVVDIVTAKSTEITISYDAFDSYRTAYATIIGGVGNAGADPGHDANGHPTITIPVYYGIEFDPAVYMVFIL